MSSADTITAEVPKEIKESEDYIKWLNEVDGSELIRIKAAIEKIKEFGIVTSAKALGDGLYEKKWKSGLRLYFSVVIEGGKKTLLLLGSKKGTEQTKAIKKSKSELENYDVFKESIKISNGE